MFNFDNLIDYAKRTPGFAISYTLINRLVDKVQAAKGVNIVHLGEMGDPVKFFKDQVAYNKENHNPVYIFDFHDVSDANRERILFHYITMEPAKGLILAFRQDVADDLGTVVKNRLHFYEM